MHVKVEGIKVRRQKSNAVASTLKVDRAERNARTLIWQAECVQDVKQKLQREFGAGEGKIPQDSARDRENQKAQDKATQGRGRRMKIPDAKVVCF
jgi:hypothetical protein